MSEMGEWINQLALQGILTRPPNENVQYGDPVTNAGTVLAEKPMFKQPGGEVAFPARAPENFGPKPTPPADPYGMTPPAALSPSLEAFLRYYQSGQPTLSPEMYQHFGGDALLQSVQGYDPNASWVDEMIGGGGEGGGMGTPGRRLNFDINRMPTSGSGIDLLNMRPEKFTDGGLKNPDYVYNDPVYGRITHGANVNHQVSGIEKYAPYIAALISMGGPALAGALAAGGIGAGAAGATSMVTGGAAGLGLGNIPGAAAASAAGAAPGASGWWGRAAGSAPRTAGSMLSGAPSMPTPPRPPTRPPIARAAVAPDAYGFDPTAFNSAGSAPRPGGNDSSMVATQFSDDPYGFSKRGF